VQRKAALVKLREIGECKRSNLNAVGELARGTTALFHAWAMLPGLTLLAGGIRSVDGHDY
jgi:hypothetical protein